MAGDLLLPSEENANAFFDVVRRLAERTRR